MSPLRWTCKSLRRLAGELQARGHPVSHTVVGELLTQQKFSLQANSKTREGGDHPDRDAQFLHINQSVTEALAANQPVISVDTKKKELVVGDFKNAGRAWRPKGTPEAVRVHDFLIKELGRAVPYGIYDLAANAGWVSVGMDNDTAEFAVQTIRRWWYEIGRFRYPDTKYLVITADGGGSNGSRLRLWKRELQRLANEIGIDIKVHHLPPGTSKWNKIEHRLFSYISQNWRARPLVSYRVIVDLISATTTDTGLKVHCELDDNAYPKGIAVSDEEMDAINISRAEFHGEWNYTIKPDNRSDHAVDSTGPKPAFPFWQAPHPVARPSQNGRIDPVETPNPSHQPVPLAHTQIGRRGGMAKLLRFRSYVGFLFARLLPDPVITGEIDVLPAASHGVTPTSVVHIKGVKRNVGGRDGRGHCFLGAWRLELTIY